MDKILSLIIESKKKRIEVLRKNRDGFMSLIKKAPRGKPFKRAIHREGKISVIGELKQASPSAGLIRKDFSVIELARILQKAGVHALSVLTEEDFFLGKINYIEEVSRKVTIPILRKDFIIDEIQVLASRAAGADAILLIARILDNERIARFFSMAKELGMDAVVEVHTEKELRRVLGLDCDIIGINNRNLNTFRIDLNTTAKLIPFISKETVVISESGISSLKDMLWIKGLGVDSVLVGEAIMRSPFLFEKIAELNIDRG